MLIRRLSKVVRDEFDDVCLATDGSELSAAPKPIDDGDAVGPDTLRIKIANRLEDRPVRRREKI